MATLAVFIMGADPDPLPIWIFALAALSATVGGSVLPYVLLNRGRQVLLPSEQVE